MQPKKHVSLSSLIQQHMQSMPNTTAAIRDLVHVFRDSYSESDIRSQVEVMIDEGHMFSTVDEETICLC